MKITQAHLDLWGAAQRQPSWAPPIIAKRKAYAPAALIDACINAQMPQRDDLDVANLLALCFSYRRRGVLRTELQRIVRNPGTLINPERRSRLALRWLRRMARATKPNR